jgi:23S rRNA pseudouridine1911/1915/1917 synthase
LSRTRVQELIRQGQACLDGKPVSQPSFRLRGGEVIVFDVIERPSLEAAPEEIPLSVLYEDGDLVVIDKPAGMVVHAGAGVRRGTVVSALLGRYRQLSSLGGALRPGIVHRLDKGTSGVLLVAKNDVAHRSLAEQFRERQVEKRYLALVHGQLAPAQGTIRLPVGRDLRRRVRMSTRSPRGREAATTYRTLATRPGFALVEAVLHTGRTHQIRVHFSDRGHPVVGDTLYGAPRELRWDHQRQPTLKRNFLHAAELAFRHPRSGAWLAVRAPLPAELDEWLRRLGLSEAGGAG